MKLLILTDHSRHSQHNSVYRLAQALSEHNEISELHTASRGDARNNDFFIGQKTLDLFAVKYDDTFCYPADELFRQTTTVVSISDFDVIFLRLPRPIPDGFFPFLQAHVDEQKIVNRPSGIIETGNKAFLLTLDRFVEPMALCSSWEDIVNFKDKFECVLKPLEDYGGRGLVRVVGDTVNQDGEIIGLDEFQQSYLKAPQPYLAMKYLKQVSQGDKRIVVAGGEILTALLRKPAAGNWLCNVAQGGVDELSEPDEREREIVAYIQPILSAKGVFYFGLDTLVNDNGQRVISEINTLSIGGIAPAELTTKKPLANIFANQFVNYLKTNNG